MTPPEQSLVSDQFPEPAPGLLRHHTRGVRQGGALDDEAFLRLGLRRALDGDQSGHAFLQARGDAGDALARSTWFDAWQSPRRLSLLEQIAARSYEVMERTLQQRDWLSAFPGGKQNGPCLTLYHWAREQAFVVAVSSHIGGSPLIDRPRHVLGSNHRRRSVIQRSVSLYPTCSSVIR